MKHDEITKMNKDRQSNKESLQELSLKYSSELNQYTNKIMAETCKKTRKI